MRACKDADADATDAAVTKGKVPPLGFAIFHLIKYFTCKVHYEQWAKQKPS